MFYEETLIDGVLHFRTDPKASWRIVENSRGVAVTALMSMSDEDRLDVFRFFCTFCGCVRPAGGCTCMNDE